MSFSPLPLPLLARGPPAALLASTSGAAATRASPSAAMSPSSLQPRRRSVLLFHGSISGGKTTSARQWVAHQQRSLGRQVGGILAEKTEAGRVFVDISRDKESSGGEDPFEGRLESPESGECVVSVGRFHFRAAAFSFAERCIVRSLATGATAIVIDEFGPLEARGEGFASIVQCILKEESKEVQLVLLVRSALLQQLVDTVRQADAEAHIAFEPPLQTQDG